MSARCGYTFPDSFNTPAFSPVITALRMHLLALS